MLDLANLGEKKDSIVEILHPKTQEPMGIKITVASPDSDKYRRAMNAAKNKNIDILQRKGNKKLTAEALDESELTVLIKSVLDWEGVVWGGTVLECNEDNVRQVFESLPWLKEQVKDFLDDRANFFSE